MKHYVLHMFVITILVLTAVIVLTDHPVSGQDTISTNDEITYSKETYTYKIVDNHEIRADVYRSPGEEIRPAIIWIHGGALIFGTRNWLSTEQLERYLKAGHTVVSIDYLLAPETKLTAIVEDLEDAYAWVRAEGPDLFKIDPDRIAVVGHSAGGYLTLMAGFRLKPPPMALVSFYGYGDITGTWLARPDSFYNQGPAVSRDQAFATVGDSLISSAQFSPDGRWKFYLYCRQQGLWPREVGGHDPDKERTWFAAYEPLRNVTPAYPPTMLLHGEEDTDVPFEQSVLMAEAFKRHSIDYEFITKPDWGHQFDDAGMKDSSVREAFDRVLIFLEKHVTSVEDEELPVTFALNQNYPNPFNPETSIRFTILKMSRVTLAIYDILGRKIRTLVSETKAAGSYNVTWNGKNDQGQQLASGLYFYKLQAGEFSATKKMMLLK